MQEDLRQLRIEQVDEQQDQHRGGGHLQDADAAPLLLAGPVRRTGFALRADELAGNVFVRLIPGTLAAQLGTPLLARLLLRVVIPRNVVELVGVFLKRGKT